jgi:hypothetical protein
MFGKKGNIKSRLVFILKNLFKNQDKYYVDVLIPSNEEPDLYRAGVKEDSIAARLERRKSEHNESC